MKWLTIATGLTVAGCVQVGLAPVAQTDTAVTLRLSRSTAFAQGPTLQEAEDYAQAHCGRRGLVPRLASERAGPDYTYLRYECAAGPR